MYTVAGYGTECQPMAVPEDERLSDHVYEYNARKHIFHIADSPLQKETLEKTPEKMVQKHNLKRH